MLTRARIGPNSVSPLLSNMLTVGGKIQRKVCVSSIRHVSYILGIETSCDDSAAAIIDSDGNVLSDVISSQWGLHSKWKGIVPNLAARAHEQNLPTVIGKALADSGLSGFHELSAVAVTTGPGLGLCLKVGVTEAKKIATSENIPFLSINHLEAHALVPRMLYKNALKFPFLTLLVSGGHCNLILAKNIGDYQILGGTVDDSVGEAYDKVAKMLGLLEGNYGVHGGRIIENYAKSGDSSRFHFTEPMKGRKDCDFSYSGLKTAVLRTIQKVEDMNFQTQADIAASFQKAAVGHLITRTKRACQLSKHHCQQNAVSDLVVCGGVASNLYIRNEIERLAIQQGMKPIFPESRYCTDNAVMVAWAGLERYKRGIRDCPIATNYKPRWPIDQLTPVQE